MPARAISKRRTPAKKAAAANRRAPAKRSSPAKRAPEKPRCAIYLRISRDPDGTSDSPERQLKDCRRKVRDLDGEVVEVFEDRDLSAYRKGVTRPGYEELLDGIAAGDFDVVVVWRLDRLVRRVVEFGRYWAVASEADCHLVSVTQPIDTTDPVGMLIVHVLVAFAEMESATTSQRLRSKEEHLARQGTPKRRSKAAYGIKAGWEELEPAEAAIIRECAERALAGESLTAIVNDLNHRQVPAAKGGRWNRRSLATLLVQARLFGKREHHGEIVADGDWPAILDETTGMRLRRMYLESTRPKGGSRPPRTRLLSGILRCGKCGGKMKAAKAYGTKAAIYTCYPKFDGGCGGTSIVADPTDQAITEMILYRLNSPELAKVLKARKGRRKADDAELLNELAAIGERRDELAGMFAKGEISSGDWKAALRSLDERTAELEAQLAELHQAEPLAGVLDEGGLAEAWGGMSLERRRAVVEAILDRVVVHSAGSEYFAKMLRESLLLEAEEAEAAGDLRLAKRRRKQAESRTGGGGSFRPERLEPIWRV